MSDLRVQIVSRWTNPYEFEYREPTVEELISALQHRLGEKHLREFPSFAVLLEEQRRLVSDE